MGQQRKVLNQRITIRFDEEEYRAITEDADTAGMSMAAFVRKKCRGNRIASKADLKVLSEVRRLGGLLKHIHNETRGAYSAKTAKAIDEITAFVYLLCEELEDRRKKRNNATTP